MAMRPCQNSQGITGIVCYFFQENFCKTFVDPRAVIIMHRAQLKFSQPCRQTAIGKYYDYRFWPSTSNWRNYWRELGSISSGIGQYQYFRTPVCGWRRKRGLRRLPHFFSIFLYTLSAAPVCLLRKVSQILSQVCDCMSLS